MGWFGTWCGGTGSGSSSSPVNPYLSITPSAASIRDRIIEVIEGLSPLVLSANPFLRFRNEGGADFESWSEENPQACLRRFQVRDTGEDSPPTISNTDVEFVHVTFEIVVSYPQTHRFGPDNALDRDDLMKSDQRQIEHAVGLCGYANFIDPHPSAAWESGTTDRRIGQSTDFLVIRQVMCFYQATP